MSFGWSAGDIVAALKLLHQIGSAVRESGGASSEFQDTLSFLQTLSRTLQHLNAVQATHLDPDLADNLREQCNHIRVPLAAFLDDVGQKFGPALGVNSRRKRIFGVPRMIQWTFSDSKKTKRLQHRIAVPMAAVSLMLSQQIIQTTLAMPENIQDRISHLIDTVVDNRIIPTTQLVDNKLASLSAAQTSYIDTITRNLQGIGTNITEAIRIKVLEDREAGTRLESHFESRSICAKLQDVSIEQSASTDLVIQSTRQAGQETANAIRLHALQTRAQSSSLHKKLEQVDTSVNAMHSLLHDLSVSRFRSDSAVSRTEVGQAIQNILRSIWILLSSLQLLIRELVMLFTPYLIGFYRNNVQGLLEYGDQFMFEDAIGRKKRLPCAQFQHWDIFYAFLIDSFKDTAGLSLVRSTHFRVMNRYNGYPIIREAWRAVIQPKAEIIMAMELDGKAVEKGRCADPSCSGRVSFTTAKTTRICPACGKHLSVLKETQPSHNNDNVVQTSTVTEDLRVHPARRKQKNELERAAFMSLVKMGPEELAPKQNSNPPFWSIPVVEITAFKRVIWQELSQETPSKFTEDWNLPNIFLQPAAVRLFGIFDVLFLYMSKITNIRNQIRQNLEDGFDPIVQYTAFYAAAEIDAGIREWTPAWPPGDHRDAAAILYRQMMWIYLWRTIYPPQTTNWKLDPHITTAVRDGVKLLSQFGPRDPSQTLLLAPAFVIGCAAFEVKQREPIRKAIAAVKSYMQYKNTNTTLEVLEEVWRLMDARDERSWDWQSIAHSMGIVCRFCG